MSFAENLKQLRKEKQLSQDQKRPLFVCFRFVLSLFVVPCQFFNPACLRSSHLYNVDFDGTLTVALPDTWIR